IRVKGKDSALRCPRPPQRGVPTKWKRFNQFSERSLRKRWTRPDCRTPDITPATDSRFGDYQTNAALILGKQRGENPREIAAKIVAQLDVDELSEPPTVAGAGFINFTLRPEAIAEKAG